MMRCIGLFIGCLFSLNIYAEKYVIGAQNLAYFPHYDFASSTDKGVAWSILEAFCENKISSAGLVGSGLKLIFH